MSFSRTIFSSAFYGAIKRPKHLSISTRFTATYTEAIRSHLCGTLTENSANQPVSLCGWLHQKRMDRFLILRDWTGLVQVILDDVSQDKLANLKIPLESVIHVRGVPQRRPAGQENPNMPTGQIEIHASEINVLNVADAQLPFTVHDRKVSEPVRLHYRYLDFRSTEMQRNLRIRSELTMRMRQFLHGRNGFVDVETPCLFRRTPGGAREFLVPSQQYGKFYSLSQSPQQFKQLLMVGGLDRYFQIARCFRDEANNPEKQPEFTQLDLEMSFVNMESIQRLIEDLIGASWPSHLGDPPITPFIRMTYSDAMNNYGTDKPDTRFSMKFHDLTSNCRSHRLFMALLEDGSQIVRAIVVPQGSDYCKTAFQRQMQDLVRREHPGVALALLRLNEERKLQGNPLKGASGTELIDSVGAGPKDLIVMCVGKGEACLKALGRMRVEMADQLDRNDIPVRPKEQFNFLWVVDFPLFETSANPDGTTSLTSAHHPFTAPMPDDSDLFHQPGKLTQIRGQHYDLVLNGHEVGGGSIRVHDAEMQRHILSLLKINPTELKHLLDALDSGCPPHGGIALGLDRLVAFYAGAESIRDVIAFPKTAAGSDLMGSAPCRVPRDQLDFYQIACKKNGKLTGIESEEVGDDERTVGKQESVQRN